MDEEIICGVCMDILDNPYTIIPCLHSVDYECLTEWWTGHSTCPVCSSRAQSARRSFQIRAIVEKFLDSNPDKRRPGDEGANGVPRPDANATPSEIKPQGHNHVNPDLDDDDDGDDDAEFNPERELIWPCFCCTAGNNTGYNCPIPIPEPTGTQINMVMAAGARPPFVRPSRRDLTLPLAEAFRRNIPGADRHAECHGCHRYVPKGRQPAKDQCAKCELWSCAEYDPEGCPQRWTLRPRDNCTFQHLDRFGPISLYQYWRAIPQRLLAQNTSETQIFNDYISQSAYTVPAVFADISRWTLEQLEEEAGANNAQVMDARRKWGIDARFCPGCRNTVVSEGLLGWWMTKKPTTNQAPSVRAKLNCWYGYECRTQAHNATHAQRLNHVCENTSRH